MSVEEFTYLRGRTSEAGQGDAGQRAAGGGLLRSRQVARRLSRRATPISPISSTSPGARSRSCSGSAASTSRSTRRSTRRCSTRRSARATASAAAIRTRCSTRASSSTTRSSTGHPGITFGIHICRGNHKSMFYASGGYDRIAEQVFSRARFDRFLLEYDDERSGTFEPLRTCPTTAWSCWGWSARRRRGSNREDELRGADRRGRAHRAARAARAQPAVRLRLHARGQPALARRSASQAGAGRADGAVGLADGDRVTETGTTVFSKKRLPPFPYLKSSGAMSFS